MKYGYEKGEICNRNHYKCKGVIDEYESELDGCSCHINPPCSFCTEDRNYCPECGWEGKDDVTINDYRSSIDKYTGVYKNYELRKLDNTRIDWYSKSHTHFSMIKEGVYPEGTTQKEVLEKVKGTFGGRFDYFENGKFKYIAYTD